MNDEHTMWTKQQLAGVLVGLKEMNSKVALRDPNFFVQEGCDADDVPLVLRMSAIIEELFDTFDYSRSPEFLRSLDGKTPEFRAMKLRLITPMRRTENRKRLGGALAHVLSSDEALDLVESSRHERIKELRTLLSEVSNEDASK